MRILIHDASVLIDLIAIDLLDLALSMPYSMETTDFIRREIYKAGQQGVLDEVIRMKKLEIIHSSIEEVEAIGKVKASVAALSIADCSIIYHAADKRAAILSGDALLRRTAAQRSIQVYGTLWVFRELVEHGSLSKLDACGRLERLMQINRRMPQAECQKLLDAWSGV